MNCIMRSAGTFDEVALDEDDGAGPDDDSTRRKAPKKTKNTLKGKADTHHDSNEILTTRLANAHDDAAAAGTVDTVVTRAFSIQ